jgi:hypothetical protein
LSRTTRSSDTSSTFEVTLGVWSGAIGPLCDPLGVWLNAGRRMRARNAAENNEITDFTKDNFDNCFEVLHMGNPNSLQRLARRKARPILIVSERAPVYGATRCAKFFCVEL